MLPDGLTIVDLLPHRDRMLLIQEVLHVDDDKAVTLSTVSADWPLTDEQGAQSLVLVELAAQTAGILNGIHIRRQRGPGPRTKGWMVGIKSVRFFTPQLALGAQVLVTSRNSFAYEGFREIHAEAVVQDRTVADITLQLMEDAADKAPVEMSEHTTSTNPEKNQ
jgi:predicted hotdog family 3-hydroxylacyl-ACP dehydratase